MLIRRPAIFRGKRGRDRTRDEKVRRGLAPTSATFCLIFEMRKPLGLFLPPLPTACVPPLHVRFLHPADTRTWSATLSEKRPASLSTLRCSCAS